jgi:bacterioferritin-associated ferredoxin
MYVCNCNGLTQKDIATAIAAAGQTVSQVFLANGCKPQCGRCVLEIRALLRSTQTRPAGLSSSKPADGALAA